MTMTAGDVLIETIHEWGVDTIFGLPGDGIMEAIRKRQDKVRFIQVRHEEAAAFLACGYAKFTGRTGCCLAASGPSGIHLLNGLYDAKLDGQPVLAITGLPFHDLNNCLGQIRWEQMVFPREPRVRLRAPADRLRRLRPRPRSGRIHHQRAEEPRPPGREGPVNLRTPSCWKVWWIPYEPPMPPKVSPARRRSSPSRWRAALRMPARSSRSLPAR